MRPIVRQYLETVLWAENDESDESGEPLDKNYSVDDFAPAAVRQAEREIQAFEADLASAISVFTDKALEEGREVDWSFTEEDVGHDFWLTRNRHGVGFWDREEKYGELARILTRFAHKAGERHAYVGDDGRIYFDPDPDYRRARGKLKLVPPLNGKERRWSR